MINPELKKKWFWSKKGYFYSGIIIFIFNAIMLLGIFAIKVYFLDDLVKQYQKDLKTLEEGFKVTDCKVSRVNPRENNLDIKKYQIIECEYYDEYASSIEVAEGVMQLQKGDDLFKLNDMLKIEYNKANHKIIGSKNYEFYSNLFNSSIIIALTFFVPFILIGLFLTCYPFYFTRKKLKLHQNGIKTEAEFIDIITSHAGQTNVKYSYIVDAERRKITTQSKIYLKQNLKNIIHNNKIPIIYDPSKPQYSIVNES